MFLQEVVRGVIREVALARLLLYVLFPPEAFLHSPRMHSPHHECSGNWIYPMVLA
jgi:hypothetical protein